MVSNEVHTELLRMADERAKRAEMRAMALEHEVWYFIYRCFYFLPIIFTDMTEK